MASVTPKTCSRPNCDRPVRTRGLCQKHYQRAWANDVLPPHERVEWLALSLREKLERGSETDPTTGCWVWQKGIGKNGYGVVSHGSRQHATHRAAYRTFVGPIPKGKLVCHTCDNRACLNPAHLFIGTDADNMHDMHRKGRAKVGENHGHAKLTAAQVTEIRARVAAGERQKDVALRFGLGQGYVSRIVNRVIWRRLR